MTHAAANIDAQPKSREVAPGQVLDAVAEALAGLRFGTVHLTVHEGRVVQLDVTERQRFT